MVREMFTPGKRPAAIIAHQSQLLSSFFNALTKRYIVFTATSTTVTAALLFFVANVGLYDHIFDLFRASDLLCRQTFLSKLVDS